MSWEFNTEKGSLYDIFESAVRVLLVSRFKAFRSESYDLLSQDENYTVVGVAASPQEAFEIVKIQRPHVIITGLYFDGGVTALDLIKNVRNFCMDSAQPSIAVLTSVYSISSANRIYLAGGDMCIYKHILFNDEDLLQVVNKAFAIYSCCPRKYSRAPLLNSENLSDAIQTRVRHDGLPDSIFSALRLDELFFVQLVTTVIDNGGLESCNLEDMLVKTAKLIDAKPENISALAESYIKRASAYARRHKKKRQNSPFLMLGKSISLSTILEHYSKYFFD